LHHHHVWLDRKEMCVSDFLFSFFEFYRVSLPHFKMQRNVFLLRFHPQIFPKESTLSIQPWPNWKLSKRIRLSLWATPWNFYIK
jgi:hypothetical protein